jgi:hypothetical protein
VRASIEARNFLAIAAFSVANNARAIPFDPIPFIGANDADLRNSYRMKGIKG